MYSPQAHKNKTQPSAEVCFVTANPTPPYPPTPSYPPPHTRRAPKCAEGVQECAPEPRAPGGRGRGGRVKGAAGDQRCCTEIGFAPAGAWPRLSYPTRGVHSVAVKNCLIVPGLRIFSPWQPGVQRSPRTCPAPPPARPPSVV